MGTLRLRLDMVSGKQEDRAYPPVEAGTEQPQQAYLTPAEWDGLALLVEHVFKPLQQTLRAAVEQGLSLSPQLLLSADLLQPYLQARNKLFRQHPQHPLVSVLRDYPDSAGNSLEATIAQEEWDRQCHTFLAEPGVKTHYWVEGAPWASQECLSAELGAQLFDTRGEPKSQAPYSSERVRCSAFSIRQHRHGWLSSKLIFQRTNLGLDCPAIRHWVITPALRNASHSS